MALLISARQFRSAPARLCRTSKPKLASRRASLQAVRATWVPTSMESMEFPEHESWLDDADELTLMSPAQAQEQSSTNIPYVARPTTLNTAHGPPSMESMELEGWSSDMDELVVYNEDTSQ